MADSDFATEAQIKTLTNTLNGRIGARQAGSNALTQIAALAVAANSGKVVSFDTAGNPVVVTQSGGSATPGTVSNPIVTSDPTSVSDGTYIVNA